MSRLRTGGRWACALLGLTAVLLAVLVPGVSAESSAKKATYTVRLGSLSNDIVTGALPLLANKLGTDAQNNVSLPLTIGANATLVTGLLSNSLDALLIDPEDFITPDEKGLDFVSIASIVEISPFNMVANPSKVHSWADLAGKTGATSQAVGFVVDSQNQMLKAAGVDPSSVHDIVVGGTSARLAALVKGQVDFSLLGVESTVAAQQAGMLVMGNHAKGASHPVVDAVDLVVRKSWLKNNLPAATAMVKALLQAAQWAHNKANRTDFQNVLPTIEGKTQSITNGAIAFWFGGGNSSYVWPPHGCPNPTALKNLFALMHSAHELRPHFSVNGLYTNQVLQAAGVKSCAGIDYTNLNKTLNHS